MNIDKLFNMIVVAVIVGYILYINHQLTIEHLAR